MKVLRLKAIESARQNRVPSEKMARMVESQDHQIPWPPTIKRNAEAS